MVERILDLVGRALAVALGLVPSLPRVAEVEDAVEAVMHEEKCCGSGCSRCRRREVEIVFTPCGPDCCPGGICGAVRNDG